MATFSERLNEIMEPRYCNTNGSGCKISPVWGYFLHPLFYQI